MIITKNLLKQFVDIPKDIYHLTYHNIIEVEAFEPIMTASNLVVGHVLTCVDHPNSDHLHITTVDLGESVEQIVCGAPNVAAGQYVIVAKVGAVLPGDFKIKASKIRGEASAGMICSLQEIGFEEAQTPEAYRKGIFAFDYPVKVGMPAFEALHLDGWKMTLGLTPNRADLLSTLGFAYDLAAMTDQTVKTPSYTFKEETTKNPFKISINTDGCGRYYARYIENIKVKESPWWLKSELIARGMTPINNVVDISNYILLAYGTPLHMFDASKIKTQEIVVRDALANEKVITLDDEERHLQTNDIVITNGKEAIALAGVMGLKNTMIDDQTTTVLLEAAYFEPKRIQKTSKRLDLQSDSSLRFERGIDDKRVMLGLEKATELLVELADATVRKGIATAIHHDVQPHNIQLSTTYVSKLLGITLSSNQLEQYFKRYRFAYEKNKDGYVITPPSDRHDLVIPADLVEEIARIHGFNNLPSIQETTVTQGMLSPKQLRNRRLRHHLADLGLQEAITYSLLPFEDVKKYQDIGDILSVLQPLSADKKALRQSLLNGLLEAASYNTARQAEHIRLFEIGHLFAQGKEMDSLGIVLTGLWGENLWHKQQTPMDFFVLKGVLQNVFAFLNINVLFKPATKHTRLHPYRQADIMYDDQVIGYMGELHPKETKHYDLSKTYVAEIKLDALPDAPSAKIYQSFSKFPSVSRDLAIVVNEDINVGDIMDIMKQTVRKNLVSLDLFDVYQGDHIEKGKKSLAFRFVFNDENQTLERETIDKLIKKVMGRLSYMYQAEIRN